MKYTAIIMALIEFSNSLMIIVNTLIRMVVCFHSWTYKYIKSSVIIFSALSPDTSHDPYQLEESVNILSALKIRHMIGQEAF